MIFCCVQCTHYLTMVLFRIYILIFYPFYHCSVIFCFIAQTTYCRCVIQNKYIFNQPLTAQLSYFLSYLNMAKLRIKKDYTFFQGAGGNNYIIHLSLGILSSSLRVNGKQLQCQLQGLTQKLLDGSKYKFQDLS